MNGSGLKQLIRSTVNNYAMGFQFLGVTKYKYVVELHGQAGSVQTIMDIDYVSSDPSDSYFENL